MIVKFNEPITKYRYILSFDLAKFNTGYSLFDITTESIVETGLLSCPEQGQESIWSDYYDNIKTLLVYIKSKYANSFFVLKEKMPCQNGGASTIQTLQALAKAHAVFELACIHCHVDVYDFDGIAAVSGKAYVRKQSGIEKPSKEDIKSFLMSNYFFDDNKEPESLDVTDSIICSIVLLKHKWNDDIKTEIRSLKKEKEKYKSDQKKDSIQKRIDFLNTLFILED